MVLGTLPARHWFCGALIREKQGQRGTFGAGEYEKEGLFLSPASGRPGKSIFQARAR